MKLNSLLKIKAGTNKRVGRGLGSGKGKTSGRGQKGQKARGKVPASFTGGGLPLYKKLPLKRGWGNRKVSPKPVIISLAALNNLASGSEVTIETLVGKNFLSSREAVKHGIKIVANGKLDLPLTVKLPVTKKVQEKILAAGGKIV